MALHMEVEVNIQLEVVTEFGHGGVRISMVGSEEGDQWGVKIDYLHEDREVGPMTETEDDDEDMFDKRFKQILSFPTFEQAKDVFNALRARPAKQCTCGA